MNFYKFNNPRTGEEYFVNMDQVESATYGEKDTILLRGKNQNFPVRKEQFEAAIQKKDENSTLVSVLNRLVQATERLTVHIPSSIRLHM